MKAGSQEATMWSQEVGQAAPSSAQMMLYSKHSEKFGWLGLAWMTINLGTNLDPDTDEPATII